MGRWIAPMLGVAGLLVVGAVGGAIRPECHETEPADAFSAKIDSLLRAVEGPDFPTDGNLDSWRDRRGDIRETLGEILGLTSGDRERRKAAVHVLLAAESLAATPSESHLLGTGLQRGEVRAWARAVLKSYAPAVVVAEDMRFVGARLVGNLQQAWGKGKVAHPKRSLPLYQEKADELRALASFRQSPVCGTELDEQLGERAGAPAPPRSAGSASLASRSWTPWPPSTRRCAPGSSGASRAGPRSPSVGAGPPSPRIATR